MHILIISPHFNYSADVGEGRLGIYMAVAAVRQIRPVRRHTGRSRSFESDYSSILQQPHLENDIVNLLCAWLKKVYSPDTLEQNLEFIAKVLGGRSSTSREIIRNYFLKDFFADHCKIYQKRPIYWLFDSGRQNGFKTLIYLQHYTPDTIGNIQIDYLHKMQRVYESEIERMHTRHVGLDRNTELNLKQIVDRLNAEFAGDIRKLVFWYDDKAEFEEDMRGVTLENASVYYLQCNNQLYTKYFLESVDTTTNYLIMHRSQKHRKIPLV